MEQIENIKWTAIPGCDDYYISDQGQVLSKKMKTPRIIKHCTDNNQKNKPFYISSLSLDSYLVDNDSFVAIAQLAADQFVVGLPQGLPGGTAHITLPIPLDFIDDNPALGINNLSTFIRQN